MILGIITAILIALCSANVLTRKRKGKTARIAHIALGVSAIIAAVAHLVSVIPVLAARPLAVWVSGALTLLSLAGMSLNGLLKRDRWVRFNRALAIAAIAALALHIAANVVALNNYQQEAKAIQITDVDLSQIDDGMYTGVCDIGYIYAKVSVTVRSGAITDVTILEHRNERGQSAERIADDVVTEQRVTADAVSGATYSSNVIRRAICNALAEKQEDGNYDERP
jgi:uncharacterized protein with FMN-binding domain